MVRLCSSSCASCAGRAARQASGEEETRAAGGEGRGGEGRARRPAKTSGSAAARLRVQRDEQLVVGLAHLARAVGRKCLVHDAQYGQHRLAANGREGSQVRHAQVCAGHVRLVFGPVRAM